MVYRSASLTPKTRRRSPQAGDDDYKNNDMTDIGDRPRRRGSSSTSRRNSYKRHHRRQQEQRQDYDIFGYHDYYYDGYWGPVQNDYSMLPDDYYYDYYYADDNNEPFQRPKTHLPRRRSTSAGRHNGDDGSSSASEPQQRQKSLSTQYQYQEEAAPSIFISDEPLNDLNFVRQQQVHAAPERRRTIQEGRAADPLSEQEPSIPPLQPLRRRHSMYEHPTAMMASPQIMPVNGNSNIPPVATATPWMFPQQPVPRPIMMQPQFPVPQPVIQQPIMPPPRPVMPMQMPVPMSFVEPYPDFLVDRPVIPSFPGMIPPLLGPYGAFPLGGVAPPIPSLPPPAVGFPLPQPPGFSGPPPGASHTSAPTSEPHTSSSITPATAAAIAGAAVALAAQKEERKKEERKKEDHKKEEPKKKEVKIDEGKKEEGKKEEGKKEPTKKEEPGENKKDEEHKKDKDESTTANKKEHGEAKENEDHKKSTELKKGIEAVVAGLAGAPAAHELRRSKSLFGSFFRGGSSPGSTQQKKHMPLIQNRNLWDPQRVMTMDDAKYVEPQRQRAAPRGVYPEGHPLNQHIAKILPPPPRQNRSGIFSRKESQRLAGKAHRLGFRSHIWCYRPMHELAGDTVVWAAFDVANQEKLQKYIGPLLNNEPLLPGTPTSVNMSSEPELRGTTVVKPLEGIGFHYKSTFSSRPILLMVRCLPNENNLRVRGPPPPLHDIPMNSAPPLSFGSQQPQGLAGRLWSVFAS